MNMVLDFHYLLISNQLFDISSIQKTFSYFSAIGIKKFIFTYAADLSSESLSQIRAKIRHIRKRIQSLCPRGCVAWILPELILSPHVVQNSKISSFRISCSDRILVRLPWFYQTSLEDWIEADLNYLLYKQRLAPLFVSFETNVRSNSPALSEKMLSGSGFCFSFDLNYITSTSEIPRINKLIAQQITILPVISNPVSCYYGILDAMTNFKERIGMDQYSCFCKKIYQNRLIL